MSKKSEINVSQLVEIAPEAFPWVRFLPESDVRVFVVELAQTLRRGSAAQVVQVIAEWRHTAEVHADPHLLATLRQPARDCGPVPAPASS
jgi:hypothetical protein